MKNITLENTREEAIKELSLIIKNTDIKKMLQALLTMLDIHKINLSFLRKHLKLTKTAAQIISNAGMLNPSTGMLLLHLELNRKPKIALENYWKDEVEAKFKIMHRLLINNAELLNKHGSRVEAIFTKFIQKSNEQF